MIVKVAANGQELVTAVLDVAIPNGDGIG